MKLYDGGRAPNPRRVRIFLAEKGLSVPMEKIDLGALQHKSAEFTAINPLQRVPVLVLDDGTVITESIAICRYFEALQPDPPLFGRGPLEIANIEMWNRRLELHFLLPVAFEVFIAEVAWREFSIRPHTAGEAALIEGHARNHSDLVLAAERKQLVDGRLIKDVEDDLHGINQPGCESF